MYSVTQPHTVPYLYDFWRQNKIFLFIYLFSYNESELGPVLFWTPLTFIVWTEMFLKYILLSSTDKRKSVYIKYLIRHNKNVVRVLVFRPNKNCTVPKIPCYFRHRHPNRNSNPSSLETHTCGDISAKGNNITSCVFRDTFKVKCPVVLNAHSVFSKFSNSENALLC